MVTSLSDGTAPKISFSLLPSLFACTYLLKAWQKEETATESSSLGWAGFTTMANVLWVALYGWWMALLFFVLAGVMALTVVGVPYANLAWAIGKYLLWPYGKYIIERVPTFPFFNRANHCSEVHLRSQTQCSPNHLPARITSSSFGTWASPSSCCLYALSR